MIFSYFNKIKHSKDYRQLVLNAASMLVIQASNYLVPLITFPFLMRTLGTESFGLMFFMQNIFSYFEQLMNYGFMFTAPKDIAQKSGDSTTVSTIFHSVVYAKLFLFLICVLILYPLFIFIPRLAEMQGLVMVGLTILLVNILQIDWFFQGIQQMKNITYANLLARLLSLILLFSFVKSPNNVAEAILSITISQIAAHVFLWQLAYRRYGLIFIPPQYKNVWVQLQQGFSIFSSQFLVRFYSADVNLTILGFLTNNVTVGTYALANKIFGLMTMTVSPISAALYPYLSKLFSTDYTAFKRQFAFIFRLYAVVYISLAIGLFLSADILIQLVSGSQNATATLILRFLALALVVAPFGSLFVQALLLHKKNYMLFYLNLILIGINIVSLIPLFIYFREIGLAINSIIIHWAIFGLQFLALKRVKPRESE